MSARRTILLPALPAVALALALALGCARPGGEASGTRTSSTATARSVPSTLATNPPVLAAHAALAAAGAATPAALPSGPMSASDAAQQADRVFLERCVTCHGTSGRGDGL